MKKIFLYGNMCSGKTLIGHILCRELKIPIFSIDDFRRMYNAKVTIPGENRAWSLYFKDIDREQGNLILESTGLSKQLKFWQEHNHEDLIYVFVEASAKTCIKRYKKRNIYIPFPYNYSTPQESIKWMDTRFSLIQRDIIIKNDTDDYPALFKEIILLKKLLND